jgi:hypothetical protein
VIDSDGEGHANLVVARVLLANGRPSLVHL